MGGPSPKDAMMERSFRKNSTFEERMAYLSKRRRESRSREARKSPSVKEDIEEARRALFFLIEIEILDL